VYLICTVCAVVTFGVLCKLYFSSDISDNIFELKNTCYSKSVIKSHSCLIRKGLVKFLKTQIENGEGGEHNSIFQSEERSLCLCPSDCHHVTPQEVLN
jgi:hypothetical protein